MDLYVTLCKAEWYYRIILSSEFSMGLWEWLGYSPVRKHLTRGFLCAVLDLSGTLWPLLIPEYSGIKRRGTPFPGLRNPGISYYGDKYPLPFYEPDSKRWLFAALSLIGIAETPLNSLSCFTHSRGRLVPTCSSVSPKNRTLLAFRVSQGILVSFLLSLSHRRLRTTRFWSIKGPT